MKSAALGSTLHLGWMIWLGLPVVALLAMLGPVGAASAATVSGFAIPSGGDPHEIAAGPEHHAGRVGRITTAGKVTEYSAGTDSHMRNFPHAPSYTIPVTLATARFSLTAGHHAAIRFKLTHAARRRLDKTKHRRVPAQARANDITGDARGKLALTLRRRGRASVHH